jgi:superoxide reductase
MPSLKHKLFIKCRFCLKEIAQKGEIMVKQDGMYKCEVCGNIISVVLAFEPPLVCCGQEMTLQEPKGAAEEGNEKHVPVMEMEGNKVRVKVGSVLHPMEEDHFIVFVRLFRDGKTIVGKRLYPGQEPIVEFYVEGGTEGITALEYCNKHGLWKS